MRGRQPQMHKVKMRVPTPNVDVDVNVMCEIKRNHISLKVCSHVSTPCSSPLQSISKVNIVPMVIESAPYSARQSAYITRK